MTADELQQEIDTLASHILFIYQGKECGVDPFSHHEYDMWYGENAVTVTSIDAVMNTPIFEGKTLREISEDIEIL